MLSINTVVDMPHGMYIEIDEIKWWSEDDGAVYGRIGQRGKWRPRGYVGTVRGIDQMRIKRPEER